ncbi:MAG: hypothetical protein ACYTJ0_08215, partial [Planctomycetota bacterium]
TPTSGPFNAPELLVTVPAVSGDDVTDITFAPNAHIYMTLGNRVLIAAPPSYGTFEVLVDNLSGAATGVALNSVGEIFVALGDLGIIEVFDAGGVPAESTSTSRRCVRRVCSSIWRTT